MYQCSVLWLNNIPLYGYVSIGLSIHLLMDTCFYLWTIVNNVESLCSYSFEGPSLSISFLFFVTLGLELRAYTLSHSTSPFL
jgi:arginine exporter protein ArgO